MFTDLHCHLLPALDDGATDAAEAVEMARALVAVGFGAATPSPHAGRDYPGADAARERLTELAGALEREGVPLQLHASAENYLDADFLESELAGRGRHVASGPWVLVELPYQAVMPALPEMLFQLRRKAIRPLIAHPERCAHFQEPGAAEAAVQAGAALQLNLGSLWGRYGRGPRKTAARLLEEGLYAVAASDLHHAEDAQRWLEAALRELEKQAGAPAVRRLLEVNPARVVRGEELEE